MTLYISFAISLFFFNDTATTEIYTLSLHDALPISPRGDGNSRKHHDTLHALIFDGRNDGHVHGARTQRFGAQRRHGEGKLVAARQRPVGKAPDERRGIQILHDGDVQLAHVSYFPSLPPSFGNNPLSHKASRRGGTAAAFDEMLFDERAEEFRDTEKAETGAGGLRKRL